MIKPDQPDEMQDQEMNGNGRSKAEMKQEKLQNLISDAKIAIKDEDFKDTLRSDIESALKKTKKTNTVEV
jgi:hypothetical protein